MGNPKTAKTLFSTFPPVSTEEWEARIKKDLDGADYKKKLRWDTGEGINPLPFYRREDLQKLGCSAPITNSVNQPWEIREAIYGSTIEETNQAARKALSRGADALQFSMSISTNSDGNNLSLQGIPIQTQADFARLVEGIPLNQTPIHIDAGLSSPALLGLLWEKIKNRQPLSGNDIQGTFCYDPLACYLSAGLQPKSTDFTDQLSQIAAFCQQYLPNARPLAIDARTYHNCGGTIIQELGFALSTASEYLAKLTDNDFSIEETPNFLHFNFSAGSNYFLEIAKFRALRLLWKNLLEAFGGDPKKNPVYIHAETSRWNKTGYDPYTNMLRTTTEGMSAAIGGCDAMTILPFDESFRQPDNFSQRIACNSQIIMREEAYIHKVQDPSSGSYYIEQLTNDLAREAWQIFQQVEERGGMLQALKDGLVQSSIIESRQKKNQLIASHRHTFVGTNQYPNPDEQRADELNEQHLKTTLKLSGSTIPHPFNPAALANSFSNGATLGDVASTIFSNTDFKIEQLHPYRGPQIFEELRLATERHKTTPTVLNLPLGNLKIRKARSAFSNNFFGCVGYDIEDPIGYKNMTEAVEAIKEEQPDIVVLCSSDEEYEQLVSDLCKQLKQISHRPLMVLAGYPEEQIEHYRKAGVDLFIHSGCNVLEILKNVQQKLNVIKN